MTLEIKHIWTFVSFKTIFKLIVFSNSQSALCKSFFPPGSSSENEVDPGDEVDLFYPRPTFAPPPPLLHSPTIYPGDRHEWIYHTLTYTKRLLKGIAFSFGNESKFCPQKLQLKLQYFSVQGSLTSLLPITITNNQDLMFRIGSVETGFASFCWNSILPNMKLQCQFSLCSTQFQLIKINSNPELPKLQCMYTWKYA